MDFDLSDTADAFVSIYTYSREQAIEDGVLVDVAPLLPECPLPIAITAAAWALVNAIPDEMQGIQDVKGRLRDAYFMGIMASRLSPRASEVTYQLIMHHRDEAGCMVEDVWLKLVIGPGDYADPCFTIMLPDED
jgi:hypothetical protein